MMFIISLSKWKTKNIFEHSSQQTGIMFLALCALVDRLLKLATLMRRTFLIQKPAETLYNYHFNYCYCYHNQQRNVKNRIWFGVSGPSNFTTSLVD